MAQALRGRFLAPGLSIDYTPGAAVTAGDVVVLGTMLGIAKRDIAANVLGALATSGIFAGVKITGALSQGDAIYWDANGSPQGGVALSGALTATAAGNTYAGVVLEDAASGAEFVKFELRATDVVNAGLANVVADPGDGNAIAVTRSGSCPLVSGGAETRTLADPTFAGQELNLGFKTDGGDCVITTASPVNQTGNNTLTFADVGDQMMLVAIEDGADIEWRVVCNDGVALSTV